MADRSGRKRSTQDSHNDDLHADPSKRRIAEVTSVNFKLVCPSSRIGSVIGKGGEIIQQIRDLSGAYVKMVDGEPNQDRIIYLASPEAPGALICPSQDAMLRILARIVEQQLPDGSYLPPAEAEAQLYVAQPFIAHILGKGGARANEIRAQSSCKIKIIRHEDIPQPSLNPCPENLIQVLGAYENVKNALLLITAHIREVVARKKNMDISLVATATNLMPSPHMSLASNALMPEPQPLAQMNGDGVFMEYRLLLLDARVGGVIGRGGEHIKSVRAASHARVLVEDHVPGCAERVIITNSTEPAHSTWCAATDALLRIAHIAMAEWETPTGIHSLQLLVPAVQASQVLTQDTIRLIHGEARAQIDVLYQIPICARPDDAVVQITGLADMVLAGLKVICGLLRSSTVSMQLGNVPTPSILPVMQSMPAMSTPMSMTQFSPPQQQQAGRKQHVEQRTGSMASGIALPVGKCVMKMTIVPQFSGAIVGKGGEHIKTLRKVSGARVKLFEAEPGKADRELEMEGSLEEVTSANEIVLRLLENGEMPHNVFEMGPRRLNGAAPMTQHLMSTAGAVMAKNLLSPSGSIMSGYL